MWKSATRLQKRKTDDANPELAKGRKGLGQWMKGFSFGTFKGKSGGDGQKKGGSKKTGNPLAMGKHKKNNTHGGTLRKGGSTNNNPYPESGHLQQRQSPASSVNGHLSFATSRPPRESFTSTPRRSMEEREAPGPSNKSGAPTLATNAETIHSDAGHSKAATTTTRGGALSSIDGAGPDSTFSSPNQSQHSLTTTLTTIQSTSANTALQGASGNATAHHHGVLNNPNQNVTFSHQYPVSPAPSQGGPASAIPRHVQDSMPNTYNSATSNNLLSDDASVLTLASSSKRRRRSMDTDASVRALAPSSVWGGSRESLPLSVLSGNTTRGEDDRSMHPPSHSRPSICGLASAERASVYSSSGITAPALASERNSYYSKHNKDLADAKSLRSVTGMDARSISGVDARSTYGGDAKSINADAKSLGGDVGSLRGYEASVRSGTGGGGVVGHGRNDSLPGSASGVGSPLASPRAVGGGAGNGGVSGGVSRRSSGWAEKEMEDGVQEEEAQMERPGDKEEGDAEPKPIADVVRDVQKAEAEAARTTNGAPEKQ